jgi:hypothetical protein
MQLYLLIGLLSSTNLSTPSSQRDALFTYDFSHDFLGFITTTMATTMESIEEQWSPLASTDILSDSWMDMANVKKAVKI